MPLLTAFTTMVFLSAPPAVSLAPSRAPRDTTSAAVAARFAAVESELPVVDSLLRQCRQRHLATAYEQVNTTTITNFLRWGRDALAHQDIAHADSIVVVLDSLERETTVSLQAYLRGDRHPLAVPRYVTQHSAIAGASFWGDVRWPDGRREHHWPLFFTGYGHFLQIRHDVPQLAAFGANAIQIEITPEGVIYPSTRPGRPFDDSTTQIRKDIRRVLDSAAKYNVAVNLLLSPHDFPAWALARWPDLRDTSGDGFIQFNIVAPRAKAILAEYLRTLIPLIKDAPALQSVTLTNEPRYDAKGDLADQQAWHAYLLHLYGSLRRCNATYGTRYTDVSQIAIPTVVTPTPVYYDWMTFKNTRFAAWHRWMADLIHTMAPHLPVQVKTLAWTVDDLTAGIDPEQFAAFSEISGNDNWISTPTPAQMLKYERFYDLLGSLRRAPIFDSEAHLLPGSAPEVRMGLWQGAIHGRNAATLWVWDTPWTNPSADHPLLTRPDVVAAVGQTGLDLERLAREVTLFQATRATTAILYTLPSRLYTPAYMTTLARAYRAVVLTGQKVDFVTEQQIAAGRLKRYRLLLIPNATHTQQSTVRGIARFAAAGGRVVAVGDSLLTRDEHDRPLSAIARQQALAGAVRVATVDTSLVDSTLRRALLRQFDGFGTNRVQLLDAETHQLPAGVEWRAVWDATGSGRWVINVGNFTAQAKRISVVIDGRPRPAAIDLVSGTHYTGETYLVQPFTPLLLSTPGM